MSREVNVNDPASWSDEDKAYLADRVESVPPENRRYLDLDVPAVSPMAEAPPSEVAHLAAWLADNYPNEVSDTESPVDTAIRLLSRTDGVAESTDHDDEYDNWKLSELRTEAGNRSGMSDVSKANRAQTIAELRKWDAEHPDA